MKWLVLVNLTILCLLTGQTQAINTCSLNKLGSATQPAHYQDCTQEDPSDGTCCYVKVNLSVNQTVSFCALIPGSYVHPGSIDQFKNDLQYTTEVNCGAGFLTGSMFLVFIILSILF